MTFRALVAATSIEKTVPSGMRNIPRILPSRVAYRNHHAAAAAERQADHGAGFFGTSYRGVDDVPYFVGVEAVTVDWFD